MKFSATVLASVSALMLSACAGQLAPRLSGPSAPVEIAPGHSVLFTDSGHRGLHVFRGAPDPTSYRVCIEPSPDTAAGMTENFVVGGFDTTTRRDRGQYGGVEIGGGGQAMSLTSGRTQTTITRDLAVELFRDTLAQACIAHAQGVISASEYASFLRAATGGALSMVAMGKSPAEPAPPSTTKPSPRKSATWRRWPCSGCSSPMMASRKT